MRLAASTSTDTQPEEPGVDGIRHELVARIRREIAAGTYDNEEKWLAAEAELLRRIEERI
jgi:anti-sigma28 factor (negative regulator of flagellin synthesis)